MKFKITMAELVESTWQVVNGTCRSGDITDAIGDGVLELLAAAHGEATGTSLGYDWGAIEELSTLVAAIFEQRGFEEAFWDRMGGTGQGICRGCGWWSEDVHHSPDDYVDPPINEDCMCGECAEELEEV